MPDPRRPVHQVFRSVSEEVKLFDTFKSGFDLVCTCGWIPFVFVLWLALFVSLLRRRHLGGPLVVGTR